ncbi:polyphosphate--glucose phosphotransferase [Robertkochia solimangrovi]|uniref:polyphosphate--glucose phosphotransferase n=1 Tax=Robertkochia solimangrovi TaxID=2213046 RepID=UPI00117EC3EE|nr:ROK family protein [Robertkochia solimangrovi]TRZ42724.1 ROK family protein [Robertkochia solimangrovi]
MEVLGIDVGASGIKGALVDIETGEMLTERFRIPTPDPATPKSVTRVIREIIDHYKWNGPVGCGFPTSIKNGICLTESNLDEKWIGVNTEEYFEKHTGLPFKVLNDADAAALCEMRFGAGVGHNGFVLVITVGTGLGSGAFFNGELIPNFELGQLYYKKYKKIEHYAANSVRKDKAMSFKKWGKRFNNFLKYVELILSPDLYIIGGGASKYMEEFEAYIDVNTPHITASSLNEAGIIGAAMAAESLVRSNIK